MRNRYRYIVSFAACNETYFSYTDSSCSQITPYKMYRPKPATRTVAITQSCKKKKKKQLNLGIRRCESQQCRNNTIQCMSYKQFSLNKKVFKTPF